MIKNRIVFSTLFISLIGLFLCSSCSTKRKLVYFQGNEEITSSLDSLYEAIIQPYDYISVKVSSIDNQAVLPFNMSTHDVAGNTNSAYAIGSSANSGYTINTSGFVSLPVIGEVKIGGLSLSAAAKLIQSKLAVYVNDPTVHIKILNYKITVLGEVKKPGTFMVANEKITLLEAIGLSGDILISGVRKNVLVVREIDGVKTETRVDITSKELFDSPVYYLRQNDVVYVEPSRAKLNSSLINGTNASLFVSVVSLIVTSIALITR